ncbi:cAMP phosphodiesterase [Prochlorococcus sp. MIT 1341]|uniref:cAMP phosphodiesterase n=1 Tax=Prochlorococcus sp. MIT 1341 TaxID=3096221 RepID=UPI002A74F0AE|nr:cAMP phosphodiesterase [Prochlorococcus sp. MIT 1341]
MAVPLLVLTVSCGGSNSSKVAPNLSNKEKISKKIMAATDKDLFLYKGIGTTYVCNALSVGLKFSKAIGIASATYTQVLNARHGGRVASVGDKKLSDDQLLSGSELQMVKGSYDHCPKEIPDEIRGKIKSALSKQ